MLRTRPHSYGSRGPESAEVTAGPPLGVFDAAVPAEPSELTSTAKRSAGSCVSGGSTGVRCFPHHDCVQTIVDLLSAAGFQ